LKKIRRIEEATEEEEEEEANRNANEREYGEWPRIRQRPQKKKRVSADCADLHRLEETTEEEEEG
jgi:hypothetical protein